MRRLNWATALVGILASAFLAAVAAAALPDNAYQRWQQVENTLYGNATWSYERIHYDPRPVDVAIIGSSRSQIGLSAPRIAARLAALGHPVTVANMSVIEDGRNLEWAIADELFRVKHPKLLIIAIAEDFSRWGHPGFKYVAPAGAIAAPPAPFLHNSLYDLTYLPYRQLHLFAASLFPGTFGLRTQFDAARYATLPVDYSQSQTMTDGVLIDMQRRHTAEELRAESRAFEATRNPSLVPTALQPIVEADSPVYLTQIARLAAARGTKIIFVYLPEFKGPATIGQRDFYARLGEIVDNADVASQPGLYQSFSHLNHAGAMIVSDRVAAAAARLLPPGPATLAATPGPGYPPAVGAAR